MSKPEDVQQADAAEYRIEGTTDKGSYLRHHDLHYGQNVYETARQVISENGLTTVSRMEWRGYYLPESGPREGVPTLTEWRDIVAP